MRNTIHRPENRIRLGFLLVLLTTIYLGVNAYWSIQQMIYSGKRQSHTHEVMTVSQTILAKVVDMETAQRGFFLTNNQKYLDPYVQASDTINLLITQLSKLVQDNPIQLNRVEVLAQQIATRIEIINNNISAYRQNPGTALSTLNFDKGRQAMDKVRSTLESFHKDELIRLQDRIQHQLASIQHLQTSFLTMSIVALIFIALLFYLVQTNIRKRTHVEQSLVQTVNQVQDLYDNAPCGYLSVDHTIFIVSANQTLLSWLGYSREDVIGKFQFQDLLSPESKKKFLDGFERDFQQYKEKGFVNNLEFEFRKKDGSSIEVIVNSMASFDAKGGFIRSRTTVFDNTTRKEYERQLLTANEKIRDLYNQAPCGYHSLSSNGEIIEINDTELSWLGYSREEVLGRLSFRDLITPESQQHFKESFVQFKNTGYVQNLEFDFLRKDKTSFPIILNASAVYDNAGKFLYSRSTVFDNTLRKAAEQKANILRAELESFTYSVSHDLRAPLRSINGYAKILQEDFAQTLDEEGKRILAVITSNANRMGQLIDDLLDFSRIGRKELSLALVDMDQLVKTILAESNIEENAKLKIEIEPLGSANADPSLIRQVWINLISNALKYSAKQPVSLIKISRTTLNDFVQYHVSDNGVGFDMKYVGKLFEVFQRLHKQQDFAGTGVGLAIVKRIITRHGGSISANASPQNGATFSFTLPRIQHQ